ncbi:hypothetical protein [Roseimicrobium sp. ORNL1]|uniref:hypothetical protein n=1 Tax=Roseimicrobium sp. ORNL1 TaxID=2711231 RepID=UPI0013E1AA81|nr:hypothetical protein [Roseimicrobium sp. ORNL1]QIF04068.1 hypothetical protein G5S37_21900 [Roseimicrobium sp. ORNL1]
MDEPTRMKAGRSPKATSLLLGVALGLLAALLMLSHEGAGNLVNVKVEGWNLHQVTLRKGLRVQDALDEVRGSESIRPGYRISVSRVPQWKLSRIPYRTVSFLHKAWYYNRPRPITGPVYDWLQRWGRRDLVKVVKSGAPETWVLKGGEYIEVDWP